MDYDYHEAALERALAADEVKRVLGACKANACEQGRNPCPAPDACRLSDGLNAAAGVLMGIVMSLAIWTVIVIAALAVFWPAT